MTRSDLTFPIEIWIEICSHLCRHCQGGHATVIPRFEHEADEAGIEPPSLRESWARQGRAALLSLARACRVLHATAEPFLYHDFSTFSPFDLYFFVRTLSERPDLRPRVFQVSIWRRDSRASIGDKLQQETVEYEKLISQLLPLTPNLQRAHIRLLYESSFPLLAQSDCFLTSLKRLTITGPGANHRDFVIDGLPPILQLAPNIEVLHYHGHPRTEEIRLPRNALKNLRELSVTGTYQSYDSVFSLLNEAIGSRLSKFSIWRTASFPDLEPFLEFKDVIDNLHRWTRTLRELSVAIHDTRSHREAEPLWGLKVLRKFRALEILRVQAISLDFYGSWNPPEVALTRILPPSLRELRLLGKSTLGPALEALLVAVRAGQFPALAKIELDEQWCQLDEARHLRGIGAGFRDVKVEFIVRPDLGGPEIEESRSLSMFYPSQ